MFTRSKLTGKTRRLFEVSALAPIWMTATMIFLAACAAPSPAGGASPATPTAARVTATPMVPPTPTICASSPVIVPTLPSVIPGYTELDSSTGMHITGKYQEIDPLSYRLEVTGKVDHPLSLTYDELRCLPKVELKATIVCKGYFEDTADWAGTPITAILDLAGVQADAASITMYGADGYSAFLTLAQARTGGNFLAYEWEGEPVPILHGFPVRAVFPEQLGNKWVKWLLKIEVE